jgi:hypothetical protein
LAQRRLAPELQSALEMHRIALASFAAAAIAIAPSARAQEAQGGQHVAPIYQTTQPSYVPQSVAMSGPRELAYNDGDPIPPGYHTSERVRKGLIIGGAVTFGTLYFFSALVAAAGADTSGSDRNPTAAMWVPGVGPFIQMTKTSSATANVFLAVDGLGQSAGLLMLGFGLFSPRTVLVRNDLASAPKKPAVAVTPMAGPGGTGMAVVGAF